MSAGERVRLVRQQPPDDALARRAARLWPDDPRNAEEWLRAVGVVRRTRRGWRLDNPIRAAWRQA